MILVLLMTCILAGADVLLQAQDTQRQVPAADQKSQTLSPAPVMPKPVIPTEQIAPTAAVIMIHGMCPGAQAGQPEKPDSCETVIKREQFDAMISSVNVTNQIYSPPALRSLAASYANLLILADAGEKAGVDKDPRFQELMRVARVRTLADAYRRFLQEKYGNPSPEDISEYYKQNISKFEQVKIDRILVPRVNPKRPQEGRPEFEKKARQLAGELRERAAKGEDMASLQVEAYNSLGLNSQPPQAEMSTNPNPTFQAIVEQDINALKPGEVTKVEFEPSGFNIYKLRSRNVIPLEQAKAQIVREISQKNIDAALKAATSGVRSDLNEQYFNPRPTGASQLPRIPARLLPPGGMPPTHPGVPVAAPAPAGSPAPATNPGDSQGQKTTPPK